MSKRDGRPGRLPLLGYAKNPILLEIFGVPVLKASMFHGTRVTPVWCIDNQLPNAKTRTIHTQAGRVKVPADFTLV